MSDKIVFNQGIATTLRFQISLHDTTSSVQEYKLLCRWKDIVVGSIGRIEGEEVVFDVPPLDHYIKVGVEFEVSLEVYIDDHRFIPYSTKGEIKEVVKAVRVSATRATPKISVGLVNKEDNSIMTEGELLDENVMLNEVKMDDKEEEIEENKEDGDDSVEECNCKEGDEVSGEGEKDEQPLKDAPLIFESNKPARFPSKGRFVVHKHLEAGDDEFHYDLRIEGKDKVLHTWMSPFLPMLIAGRTKKLKIRRGLDHSIDWLDFEGRFKSEKGIDEISIFDQGVYEIDSVKKGEAVFVFSGEKLKNTFTLKKIDDQYILLKED